MLKIDNLTKDYGDFSLNVSMEVREGRVTGLIGPNGAGKSTTFKAVLGLIRSNGGQISIFGEKLGVSVPSSIKQRIGAALADSGFSGYITVRDATAIQRAMFDSFDSEFFLEKCGEFKLPLDKPIKEFSTGMKARLRVLTALSHDADLLILDEPTAGLDAVARDEVLGLLRGYMSAKEDHAILISSHISSDLESICDDFYLINSGRIVLHEDTDVLLSDYALLKLSASDYEALDKTYILNVKKENYGWLCLTSQKKYYMENYPDIVIENGTIDDLILMSARGESL
ncbi:MAG: ABC transporter ATP-binding protein [Eubacteriales bacterium]|nr:ABC transporter ATP-binding protein [Eubacteriales bacterium]